MMTDEEVAKAVTDGDINAIKGREVEIEGPIKFSVFMAIYRLAKSVRVY